MYWCHGVFNLRLSTGVATDLEIDRKLRSMAFEKIEIKLILRNARMGGGRMVHINENDYVLPILRKLLGLSPRANYADRTIAACRIIFSSLPVCMWWI
jgi:hypothetical protein